MSGELMDAVLASADDDDDARLVYADWCEDEGDLDRATFIRTQVERTRLPRWDVRQIALRNLEEKLIAAHGKTWLAEAPSLDGVTWTGFERGFVAHAEVDSFAALAIARDAIVKSTPLHRVLVPWPQNETEAREAATIPTLRALRIQQEAMEDAEEPRWLAMSPMLAGVVELELVDGWAADPGTRTILASPHLRGLRRLELVRNEIGREAVHALADGDFPDLIELKLEERGQEYDSWSQWEGGLDEAAMQVFSAWAGLARLKRLDLSYNRIPPEGFDALFHSAYFAVESLKLEYTFTHAGQMPWSAVQAQLKELDLSHQHFYDYRDDEVVLTIQESACVSELRWLSLQGAVFREATHIQRLLGSLAPTLEALDYRGVDIDVWPQAPDDARIRALLGSQLPSLHTLRVGNIYDELKLGADVVAWADTEKMRWLHFVGTSLEAAAKALAEATLPNLQRLELQGTNDAAKALVVGSPLGKRLLETGGLRFLPGPRR